MSSPFNAAGALSEGSNYAPIHVNRMFTGLYTNRNPLREGAVPYLYERNYAGARYDSLLDGVNVEISAGLTLARRAGATAYNSASFPKINRFYPFRRFSTTTETITVMADTASTVYDATGPNTKAIVFNKSEGAGSTYFQSVGNVLFFCNGVDQKKWRPDAGQTVSTGGVDIDTISRVVGFGANQSVGIVTVETATPHGFVVGQNVTIADVDDPDFDMESTPVITVPSPTSFTYDQLDPAVLITTDSTGGTATGEDASGGLTSGVEEFGTDAPEEKPDNAPLAYVGAPCRYWAPNTNLQAGYSVLDANGDIQLLTGNANISESLSQTLHPTVLLNGWTNNAHVGDYEGGVDQGHQDPLGLNDDVTLPYQNPEAAFDANPETAASCIVQHSHKYAGCVWGFTYDGDAPTPASIKLNVLSGISGPIITLRDAGVWYTLDGGTTWTELYQAASRDKRWDTVTIPADTDINDIQVMAFMDSHDDMGHQVFEINLALGFEVVDIVDAGSFVTGDSVPNWNGTLYGRTVDGTAIWQNCGAPSTWPATTELSLAGPLAAVIDVNGNLQVVQTTGITGDTEPTWATTAGQTTADGTVVWFNCGPGATVASKGWNWVFAFHCLDGHVSTASPLSRPSGPVLGIMQVPLSGPGSADPQVDAIWVFRNADGGGTGEGSLLKIGSVANGGVNQRWTFTDTASDDELDILIQAPINNQNDPPPDGLINLTYHLGSIFGSYGNVVVRSRTANAMAGDPLQSFPPAYNFVFPSTVRRLWPCTIGLLVFTVADTYIILGKGTAEQPYNAIKFAEGRGLLNYDAFTVNGATVRMFTTTKKLISFDPGAGILDEGAQIGDLLKSEIDPTTAQVAWHESGSGDTAIYVADGETGWYRMAPVTFPETGTAWSPKANIVGGCSAVQSVEVAPGLTELLIGPPHTELVVTGVTVADGVATYAFSDQTGTPIRVGAKVNVTGFTATPENNVTEEVVTAVTEDTFSVAATDQDDEEADAAAEVVAPILKRDVDASADNEQAFPAFATIGSIVLAQPGHLADIEFITLDSVKVGRRPTVGILLGELSGRFEQLVRTRQDPTKLPPSETIYNDRYVCAQNQNATLCRHFQMQITWATEDVPNELLAYTIFGGVVHDDKRSR